MGLINKFTLGSDQRLKKRRDFLLVQKYGVRAPGKFVVVIARNFPKIPISQIGITTSKKVGRAHERNLIKRRIRHIIRHELQYFKNTQIVVIAKIEASTCRFLELKSDILQSLNKISSQLSKSRR